MRSFARSGPDTAFHFGLFGLYKAYRPFQSATRSSDVVTNSDGRLPLETVEVSQFSELTSFRVETDRRGWLRGPCSEGQ